MVWICTYRLSAKVQATLLSGTRRQARKKNISDSIKTVSNTKVYIEKEVTDDQQQDESRTGSDRRNLSMQSYHW